MSLIGSDDGGDADNTSIGLSAMEILQIITLIVASIPTLKILLSISIRSPLGKCSCRVRADGKDSPSPSSSTSPTSSPEPILYSGDDELPSDSNKNMETILEYDELAAVAQSVATAEQHSALDRMKYARHSSSQYTHNAHNTHNPHKHDKHHKHHKHKHNYDRPHTRSRSEPPQRRTW